MTPPLPNRVAVYLTGAIALLLGLAPLIGNLDWESTAGIVAALIAILSVVVVWLQNWGKWERGEGAGLLPGELEDDFDPDTAEPIPPAVVAAAERQDATARHQAEHDTTYDPAESQRDNPPGFASP